MELSHRPTVPDFFLVGVARAGTMSMYSYLGQHPQIFMPRQKESCYTCPDLDPGDDQHAHLFVRSASAYRDLYRAARPGQLVGDACHLNIYSALAAERILELSPAARILIHLRDPVEQMRSMHSLHVLTLNEPAEDFAAALDAQAARRARRTSPPRTLNELDLRDKASVSAAVGRFVATFGRQRVHFNLYEDLALDPAAVYRSTLRFLGVAEAFSPRFEVKLPNRKARLGRLHRLMGSPRLVATTKQVVPRALHPYAGRLAMLGFRANRLAVSRPPLEAAVRDRLRHELRPEVDRLSEVVGIDLAARWWPAG